MPFKSKAQMEKFREKVAKGEMPQATFDKWLAETPNPHLLPDRVEDKLRHKPFSNIKTVKPIKPIR